MKKSLLSLFIISVVIAGCADESDKLDNESRLSVECYSRASEYAEKGLVRDFGMYITESDPSYGSIVNPVHVMWSGDNWSFPSLSLSDKSITLAAFYPYDVNSVITSVPMQLSGQVDYLASASYTASNESPRISFTMDHLLTCIKVSIDSSSDVTLTAQDVPMEASYNMSTHTTSLYSSIGSLSGNSELLLFPEMRSISLRVSYGGKVYQYVTPRIDFEKGKKYAFNLTVDRTENLQLVGDVLVTPWAPGGNYDGVVKN